MLVRPDHLKLNDYKVKPPSFSEVNTLPPSPRRNYLRTREKHFLLIHSSNGENCISLLAATSISADSNPKEYFVYPICLHNKSATGK